MSHLINLDGIAEKLIILQHFSFGSKKYCENNLIGGLKDVGDSEFDDYWGWTKSIVCNSLLECSIKLRVIQDTFKNNSKELKLFDEIARKNLVIGEIIKGNFELSLRESCNKIIHALNVVPIWSIDENAKSDFKYWNGEIELIGDFQGKNWKIILNVWQWAKAYEILLDLIDSSEVLDNMGQDYTNSKSESKL